MKKLRVLTALLLIVVLSLTGCSNQSKKITLGEINENTYTNDFFGMTFTIDDDWYILSREEMAAISDAGSEVLAEANEDMAKKADLAKEKTLNLLFISQHPLDQTEDTNANFFCIAENLGLLNGVAVKSGKDYIDILKRNLTDTGLPYTIHDPSSEVIGGKTFATLEVETNVEGFSIKQKYYSILMDNYVLSFIATYFSDDDLTELNDMLAKVKFEH